MCRAREGTGWYSWEKVGSAYEINYLNVCIEDQYRCDGIVHCKEWEDEVGCPQRATERCGHGFYENRNWVSGYHCRMHYNQPDGRNCEKEDDLLCTARAGEWAGRKICLGKEFQCDNYLQCVGVGDKKLWIADVSAFFQVLIKLPISKKFSKN